MTTSRYAELLWYFIQFLRRGVFALSDKAKRNLNVPSSGVGQKWKFSYGYFIWQPADMLNFYDTSYSFCDEEYLHYQTLGWAKSETFRTVTLYDNRLINWTSLIPHTVFFDEEYLHYQTVPPMHHFVCVVFFFYYYYYQKSKKESNFDIILELWFIFQGIRHLHSKISTTAASSRTARRRRHPALASKSKQSLESQAADVDEQATAASSYQQDRRRGRPALASDDQ